MHICDVCIQRVPADQYLIDHLIVGGASQGHSPEAAECLWAAAYPYLAYRHRAPHSQAPEVDTAAVDNAVAAQPLVQAVLHHPTFHLRLEAIPQPQREARQEAEHLGGVCFPPCPTA